MPRVVRERPIRFEPLPPGKRPYFYEGTVDERYEIWLEPRFVPAYSAYWYVAKVVDLTSDARGWIVREPSPLVNVLEDIEDAYAIGAIEVEYDAIPGYGRRIY